MHVKSKKWAKCPRKKLSGECFLTEICQEVNRLSKKLDHTVTHNKRLCRLALPKSPIAYKYEELCPLRFVKGHELVLKDERQPTRTVQLAYPPVRKLLLQKAQFQNVLGEKRVLVLNRNIRKSLFSVYSRLANIQPPKERIPIKKWTKRQWKRHGRYFRKLARPKKYPKPSPVKVIWKPIELMKRYPNLAIPKKREEYIKPKWTFTNGLKYYTPTDRTLRLAIVPDRETFDQQRTLPVKISMAALKYKATPRTLELSEPYNRRQRLNDLKENPFDVSPNALKYQASKRTKELAEPREYENVHERPNPFSVSPKAIKAKASERTKQLAEPIKK